MENKPYFDRDLTEMLKGVALVLMFVHHFFTFPEWIVVNVNYKLPYGLTDVLCGMTKICVSVFVFLNGYFEYYRKNKSISNCVKKITDIIIAYWVSYVILLLLAIATKTADLSPKGIIMEFLAIDRPIMVFCWYIPFYAIGVILMKPIEKMIDKGWMHSFVFGILLPCLIFSLIATFLRSESTQCYSKIAEDLAEYLPLMVVGYICARNQIFTKVFDKEIDSKLKNDMIRVFLYVSLAIIIGFIRFLFRQVELSSTDFMGISKTLFIKLDVVYGPIFVYCLINILRIISKKIKLRILCCIGRYSMYMWFISCAFFNVSKIYMQKILYLPRNVFSVLIWGTAICLSVAIMIDIPIKRIIQFKNELFWKSI